MDRNRMDRNRKFRVAGFFAIALALPMLIAASGGFPSRPRFLSVGVNAAAGATGTITGGATLNLAATAIALDATAAAGVTMSGTTIPRICAFDADVDAAPSIIASFNCSPSIARNSAGNFTVTHNFALANQYQINCNQRTASGTTPGFVSFGGLSSNTTVIRTYDAAGAASDGLQNVQCLIYRFNMTP